MPESGCREQSEKMVSRFEDVPFPSIPGQSKLFLQYLEDPLSLREYYPSAIYSPGELTARTNEVLSNHFVDRDTLCDILSEQNTAFVGSLATSANIVKLRDANCVAVLTGQQAGLFTGPLYTIYKALSAVRFAEELKRLGVEAVPVFWIATEDHDLEEVSNAFALADDGQLAEARAFANGSNEGKPVGEVRFGDSIATVIAGWLSQLPRSGFSDDLGKLVKEAYVPGENFGKAFGCLLSSLLGKYGLIVFDPLDERVKRLASPIFEKAIGHSREIVDALMSRSRELTAAGYHDQVLVEENYFPLFWHDDSGMRVSVKRVAEDRFRIAGSSEEIELKTLAAAANSTPGRFSPGVMLRPVVQDYLFPTICYIGGGAEIAYFAQNSEVYRILDRPVTPIFHRQSFTIVEPKHARTLEKYQLKFEDVFRGFDAILPEIIEHVIDPEAMRVFADAEAKINIELDRLDLPLAKIDPTLSKALATRRRKVVHHITALRTKFDRARIRNDEVANRRLRSFFNTLYPKGGLQERTLNFSNFANLYGVQFVGWIYDSADVSNKNHRVLYL